MAAPRPPTTEPSNRLPWIVLGLGALLILFGVVAFLTTRGRDTTVTIEGTPTGQALARSASPAVPATLAAPTLPASQPTTTPQPTLTPAPAPTTPPPPTPLPATPKPQATLPPAPAAPAAAPTSPPPTAPPLPTPAPALPAAAASPATGASPGPVTAAVTGPGGVGNTRADQDAAFGNPSGETAQHLVAYRKNNVEYHVQFVPDLNGRAALVAEIAPATPPLTLEAAMAEARKLLPRDAQPPSPAPEGSDAFVVQRFTSPSLLAALGPEVFQATQSPPGQVLVVYARDPAQNGRITRIVVGVGNDPAEMLDRSR